MGEKGTNRSISALNLTSLALFFTFCSFSPTISHAGAPGGAYTFVLISLSASCLMKFSIINLAACWPLADNFGKGEEVGGGSLVGRLVEEVGVEEREEEDWDWSAMREADQMRSWRARSESGMSASICL